MAGGPPATLLLASLPTRVGGWRWTGNFTTLDLIAAGTNALNGALPARRPDHYKNFTLAGIMLMALLMGPGGGMTRDVLINQVPGALTGPAYITVALICGAIGYLVAYSIAVLTGIVRVICDAAGLPAWASALIALVIGYTVRVIALYRAWEEPLAREPAGVYIHDDGRPMLGRKLRGKPKRELAYLGLAVDEPAAGPGGQEKAQ